MTYALEVSKLADRKFRKLAKRDKKQLEAINNKIAQILANPYHFKPLRGDMHGSRRAHIESSFVLIYEIDEQKNKVRILDYDHHDKVYKK